MKIELEVYELVALQRTTEVDSLQRQLDEAHETIRNQSRADSRAYEEKMRLQDRIHELEQACKLPVDSEGLSLERLSTIFEAFVKVGDPNYSPKIAAIRLIRTYYGCGLREAKMTVEGTHHTDPDSYKY